jgi:hypothetical protein
MKIAKKNFMKQIMIQELEITSAQALGLIASLQK